MFPPTEVESASICRAAYTMLQSLVRIWTDLVRDRTAIGHMILLCFSTTVYLSVSSFET